LTKQGHCAGLPYKVTEQGRRLVYKVRGKMAASI